MSDVDSQLVLLQKLYAQDKMIDETYAYFYVNFCNHPNLPKNIKIGKRDNNQFYIDLPKENLRVHVVIRGVKENIQDRAEIINSFTANFTVCFNGRRHEPY